MRLELDFAIEKTELPNDFRKCFISFLKYCISNAYDGRYYNNYYKDTNTKDFSFAVVLDCPVFTKHKAILDNPRAKLIFSADDKNQTGLLFFQAFLNQKNKRFPLPDQNAMTLKRITQKRDQFITSQKVLFQMTTGGGLLIRDHNPQTNKDSYYTFEDEKFQKQFRQVVGNQAVQAGFSKQEAESVKITPVRCKKVLSFHYGVYVDTTIGIIQLEGPERLLQYFYQAGIGSKHASGFGCMDVIAQSQE